MKRTGELKRACVSLEIKYTSLKKSQATRWNSIDTNVESVIRLKKAIRHLSYEDDYEGFWKNRNLNESEWKVAEGIHKSLEKVKTVTKVLEADKKPTINMVVNMLFNLREFLIEFGKSPGTDM